MKYKMEDTEKEALEFNSFLIIFGFLLFSGILNILQSIGKDSIELWMKHDLGQLENISILQSLILVNSIFLILFMILMYFFLKKKKIFLKVYIFILIASILSYIYDIIVLNNIEYLFILIKLGIALSLLVYFIKSKEVKQTFIY